MTLDRTKQPPVFPFGELTIPMPVIETLPNGSTLYIIDKGDQEVTRIDLLFEGGRYAATNPAIADLTGPMLRKGIPGMDENDIALLFDYNGAWIQTATTQHFSTISLLSINSKLPHLLPTVAEMIMSPTLPADAFDTLQQQRTQQQLINREKVRILAGESFNRLIFGENHPYARAIMPEDFSTTTLDDIRQYHKQYYLNTPVRIILSGRITPLVAQCVRQYLGNIPSTGHALTTHSTPITPQALHTAITHKSGAMQSALRIGMPTIDVHHQDFPTLTLLNLILGGYFGSRLMTNIREEKGYTYGITSHIISLRNATYFTIITETGTEYTHLLLDEVRNEMNRLCNEKISHEELEIARNYMQGQRARTLDSPFSISDYLLSSLIAGTPIDYFNTENRAIRQVTPDDLLRVANAHLHPNNYYVAIACDKDAIDMDNLTNTSTHNPQ